MQRNTLEMAEINEFDDQLKDALGSLGDNISPEGWDTFAEKLSATEGLSTMDDPASFDGIIRERMDGLEVNADPFSWDALESKIDQELNAPQLSDEALDHMATDNLSNLYIPYNPTHWTLMSHRLEEEFNVRRKIVTYKLAEFSLMILLLLTIIQFLPSYPTTSDIVTTDNKEPQTEILENQEILNAISSIATISNSDEITTSNTISSEASPVIAPVKITTKPPSNIPAKEERTITSNALQIPSKIVSVEISMDNNSIKQQLGIVAATPQETVEILIDEEST